MCLTTLASLKTHLNVNSSDTSQDTRLTQFLAQASDTVRKYCGLNLGWVISTITVGSGVATLLVPAHGLQTGQTIVINRSQCTPSIDGSHVVTAIDDDNLSVVATLSQGSPTNAAKAGYFARTYSEFYGGENRRELILRQRPIQAVLNLWYDPTGYFGQGQNAFQDSTSLLTDGVDYALRIDNNDCAEKCLSGIVLKINGYWPGSTDRTRGLLAANPVAASGNLKVQYTGGWSVLPSAITYATNKLSAVMRREAPFGGALTSENLDYYSYQLGSAQQAGSPLWDIQQALAPYKALQL